MADPEPYYTASALRAAVLALTDPTKYPDALLEGLIAEFEDTAERYRGVAFTPRDATYTHRFDCWGSTVLLLPQPRIRSVSAISVDGTDLTEDQLDTVYGDSSSLVYPSGFTAGVPVVVTYSHGYDAPPPAVLRACREFVRFRALAEVQDRPRNVLGQTNFADQVDFRYGTSDWNNGRPTGIIEVDDALNTVQDERIPAIA